MLRNVRAELFYLKQYGFSTKLLEFLYQNNMNPIYTIFNSHPLSHQQAVGYFTKKDIELSEDFSKFEIIVSELKHYFSMHTEIKLYFKYDENAFSKLMSRDKIPMFLYSSGDETLLSDNIHRVAIIGTRTPSEESIERAKCYTKRLALSGKVIVSGLAEGVDTVVHTTTLEVGGKTIAVLPTNFDNIYPKANKTLSDKIKSKGILITAIGPREHTYRSSFLDRNKIVAAISDEILVIETGLRSGTMNTIRNASKLGKKIYFLNQKNDEVNQKLLSYGGEMLE